MSQETKEGTSLGENRIVTPFNRRYIFLSKKFYSRCTKLSKMLILHIFQISSRQHIATLLSLKQGTEQRKDKHYLCHQIKLLEEGG